MNVIKYNFFWLFFFFFPLYGYGQNIVEDLSQQKDQPTSIKDQLFNEKIITVSSNKRIYVITNEQKKMIRGDFITILQNEKPIMRGLVVKTRDDQSGIKIVKVYAQDDWLALAKNNSIDILRGDDSYYWKQLKEEKAALTQTTNSSTNSSNTLPSSTETQNDLAFLNDSTSVGEISENDSDKKIKSNNMLHFAIGQEKSIGINSDSASYLHYQVGWTRQLLANWWAQLGYGYSIMKKFPAPDIDSGLNVFSFSIGYLFELPLYSFLLPYIGMEKPYVVSPGAGALLCNSASTTCNHTVDAKRAQNELDLVADAQKISPLFGITFYKRLVPGWTMRASVDNRLIGLGLDMEY